MRCYAQRHNLETIEINMLTLCKFLSFCFDFYLCFFVFFLNKQKHPIFMLQTIKMHRDREISVILVQLKFFYFDSPVATASSSAKREGNAEGSKEFFLCQWIAFFFK